MSALQWALLILSVAIVVAVVVISRRQRGASIRSDATQGSAEEAEPAREQLDIFAQPANASRSTPLFQAFEQAASDQQAEAPASLGLSAPRRLSAPAAVPQLRPVIAPMTAPEAGPTETPPHDDVPVIAPLGGGQFDEFGVGRARRRVAPSLDSPAPDEAAPVAPPPPERLPPWVRSAAATAPTAPARAQASNDAMPPPAVAKPVVAKKGPAQKIIALLLVEREGGVITGTKLHSVLAAQGLAYGNKQIYHRMIRDQPVFSVASLVKPGVLVPADAAQFSTPGLSAFLVLPGPMKPVSALHDLLATAQALARALNAEVYDSKKQPLSSELMRALQADVEAWARTAQA